LKFGGSVQRHHKTDTNINGYLVLNTRGIKKPDD